MEIGSTTTTPSTSSLQKLGEDYTSFLKLLTAQIQHQDPLQPIDSTQFVSQLAQLTQVEQSVVTNNNLENIYAQISANAAMSDIQLIGHDVLLATDTIELIDGAAKFEYAVDDDAGLVKMTIKAEDGTVVRELTGLKGLKGEVHKITWDGLDNKGLPVPDAVFTVELEAKTTDGTDVSGSVYAATRVEELSFERGTPTLILRNGNVATSGSVVSIR